MNIMHAWDFGYCKQHHYYHHYSSSSKLGRYDAADQDFCPALSQTLNSQ
jgi:hypothetical protein